MTSDSIGDCLAEYTGDVRERLDRVRAAILVALPGAEQSIKYGMPAVTIRGRHHIYFAAWKKHIGVYPVYRSGDPIEADLGPLPRRERHAAVCVQRRAARRADHPGDRLRRAA